MEGRERDRELEILRGEIEKLPSGQARRIPISLSSRIALVARKRIEDGRTRSALARQLSISAMTLDRALGRGEEQQAEESSGFQCVEIHEPKLSQARMVTPNGIVIERLMLDEIIRLVRELG